jgi:Fe-S-cluster containining protein
MLSKIRNPRCLTVPVTVASKVVVATPAGMTVAEADAAMDAGLAKQLMRDFLLPDDEVGNSDDIYVLCPAARGYENGQTAPRELYPSFASIFDVMINGIEPIKLHCVFLQNERCSIHNSGFKPSACSQANACEDLPSDKRWSKRGMAPEWDTPAGKAAVARWEGLCREQGERAKRSTA